MIKQDELLQNRYRIIRLLGSGGFGAVYLAEDSRLGRAVAIKEMDATRLDIAERPTAEQLFEREARMLASLDHPGLTRIWDYFQIEQHAFLVMEYVPGHTLREELHRRGGPLDEPFVLECALQLCDVLHYLHTRNPQVIFRDLKPANVMLVEPAPGQPPADPAEGPTLRLIDFGIARLFKPEQTGDTLIIGTPGYAPPEQYGRGQTDQRSDIYSLGATLHQLLSGQAPSSVPPPPLQSLNPAVSPALARAVARATEPEPADRYQTIAELRQDLLALRRAGAQTAQPAAPNVAIRPPTPKPAPAATPRVTTPLPAPARTPAPPAQSSASMPMILIVLVVLGVVVLGTVGLRAFNQLAGPIAATPRPAPTVAPAAQEWSLPDAPGKIAFGQRGAGGFDVWVAPLDGQPPRRLTTDGQSYSPAWSADGTRVGLTNQRDIYVGTPDNPLGERIDLGGREARYPVWSPDGRRLAMATRADEQSWQLTIVDLDTRQVTFPEVPRNIGGLAWSPGRQIAFAAQPSPGQPQDIFVLEDGQTARNITNTPTIEEDLPGWAPDGRQLACAASPAGADKLGQRQIVALNADGSGRTQLTSGPGPHTNPVWSPDGQWIAYVAQENSPDWQVWAMRADGSAPRALTTGPERKFYLAWGK